MAGPYFVKTGGDDTNDGLSWATGGGGLTPGAFATVAYANSVAAAGDTIVVDSTISEALSATLTGSSTKATPTIVISATAQTSGTTITYAAGATLTRSTASLAIAGEFTFYGVNFTSVGSSYDVSFNTSDSTGTISVYDATITSGRRITCSGQGNKALLYNCTGAVVPGNFNCVQVGGTTSHGAELRWYGGTLTASTSSASYHVVGCYCACIAEFYGVDMSALNGVTKLYESASSADVNSRAYFCACKTPANITSTTLGTVTRGGGVLVERSNNSVRSQTAKG